MTFEKGRGEGDRRVGGVGVVTSIRVGLGVVVGPGLRFWR